LNAAVTGEHVALAVDQYRYEEGEGFDTARYLADLSSTDERADYSD
jgi:hypothetical protein